MIDVEDYVQPKDLKQALVEAGLFDRVWKPSPKQIRLAVARRAWCIPKTRTATRTRAGSS